MKNLMEICSLDEFIEKNQYPVVNDSSFAEDITKLQGMGYFLAVADVVEGETVKPGFGIAYILNEDYKRSGYILISSGGQNPDGSNPHFEYLVKDDALFWGALPGLDKDIAAYRKRRGV